MEVFKQDLSHSQPDLILPVEILIQIFEDYLAFRNRRAELNGMEKQRKAIDRRFWELYIMYETRDAYVDSAPTIQIETPWSILPSLLACKLFATILMPRAYRDFLLSEGQEMVAFLSAPNLRAYRWLKTLDMRYLDDRNSDNEKEVETTIQLRIKQAELVAALEFDSRSPLDGILSEVSRFMNTWKAEHLPRIDNLYAYGRGDKTTAHIVQL
jgi:hypothetical protein